MKLKDLKNTISTEVPIVKPSLLKGDGTVAKRPKGTFEDSLDKLDLQGVLLMLTILSERALYLQSKSIMDKPKHILSPLSSI